MLVFFRKAILLSFLLIPAFPALAATISFERFTTEPVYGGEIGSPDFKGRDSRFDNIQTLVLEALQGGVNFAGEFTVVEIGCGTNCFWAVVVNGKTGRIFQLDEIGWKHGNLKYRPDSRLLIAERYELIPGRGLTDGKNVCFLDFFEWRDLKLNLLKQRKIGTFEDCAAAREKF